MKITHFWLRRELKAKCLSVRVFVKNSQSSSKICSLMFSDNSLSPLLWSRDVNFSGCSSLALWKSRHKSASRPVIGQLFPNTELWLVVTEPKVVVHDEYLCGVLICLRRPDGLRGILWYWPVTTSIHYHIITLQSHKSISKINYFRTVSYINEIHIVHKLWWIQ